MDELTLALALQAESKCKLAGLYQELALQEKEHERLTNRIFHLLVLNAQGCARVPSPKRTRELSPTIPCCLAH